jgi:hypothetical protein
VSRHIIRKLCSLHRGEGGGDYYIILGEDRRVSFADLLVLYFVQRLHIRIFLPTSLPKSYTSFIAPKNLLSKEFT